MFEVIVSTEIDSGHSLDLPYESKCNGLHGHRWKIEVKIGSEILSDTGMVVDFTHVKEIIRRYDHKMMMQEEDLELRFQKYIGDDIAPLLAGFQGFELLQDQPTAENLSRHFAVMIQEGIFDLPFYRKNKPLVQEVRIWETPSGCSIFRPTPPFEWIDRHDEEKVASGVAEEKKDVQPEPCGSPAEDPSPSEYAQDKLEQDLRVSRREQGFDRWSPNPNQDKPSLVKVKFRHLRYDIIPASLFKEPEFHRSDGYAIGARTPESSWIRMSEVLPHGEGLKEQYYATINDWTRFTPALFRYDKKTKNFFDAYSGHAKIHAELAIMRSGHGFGVFMRLTLPGERADKDGYFRQDSSGKSITPWKRISVVYEGHAEDRLNWIAKLFGDPIYCR